MVNYVKLITNRIRGTKDLLPEEYNKWNLICNVIKSEAELYNFKFIRTPVIEHTELFERSTGESSDIVTKEMYNFKDKGGRDVCLRPEGTAGVLRAVLENGLHNNTLPLKLMYNSSCYRYEKPQNGRYREFFQFGLEIFGSESPESDAQLISLGNNILTRLNLKNITLEINTIGCPDCRKKYLETLKNYFVNKKQDLCETCQERLEKNTLRILDCKNKTCQEICENSPVIINYICPDCNQHFEQLKSYLNNLNINYNLNYKIVRGLDYYSRTVFEFKININNNINNNLETKPEELVVCGGGRYDKLSEIFGGPKLPAIGLGIGLERVLLAMESQNIEFPEIKNPEVFIISLDNSSKLLSFKLCEILRQSGVSCDLDLLNKNLKSQLKYADKLNYNYVIIIGEEEVKSQKAKLKNMNKNNKNNTQEHDISINLNNFLASFMSVYLKI